MLFIARLIACVRRENIQNDIWITRIKIDRRWYQIRGWRSNLAFVDVAWSIQVILFKRLVKSLGTRLVK